MPRWSSSDAALGELGSPLPPTALDYARASRWVGRALIALGAFLALLIWRQYLQDHLRLYTSDVGMALWAFVFLAALLVGVPVALVGFRWLTRRLDARGCYGAWRFLGWLAVWCTALSLLLCFLLWGLLGRRASDLVLVWRGALLIDGMACVFVTPLAALWCLGLRRR